MDVMNSGCETDDLVSVDGNDDMMPRVIEKFLSQRCIDWIVKDVRRDVRENVLIAGGQNFELGSHRSERYFARSLNSNLAPLAK